MSFGYLQSREIKKKKLKTITFYSRHYNNNNSNYVLHDHDLTCLHNLLEMTSNNSFTICAYRCQKYATC